MSTHTVSPQDVSTLLQILGAISLLFAAVTLFDPANIFVATTPLTAAGLALLLLPLSAKFQNYMEIGMDHRKKHKSDVEGSETRQARRQRIRRERKYA